MGANDGTVEHQPFEISVSTQFLEQPVDQTPLQPAIVTPLDRLKGTKLQRRILPSRPGARHPKQRIDKTPVVRSRPTLALAAAGDQWQNPRPLIITQLVSIQNCPPKISFGIIIFDLKRQARDELSPRPRAFSDQMRSENTLYLFVSTHFLIDQMIASCHQQMDRSAAHENLAAYRQTRLNRSKSMMWPCHLGDL